MKSLLELRKARGLTQKDVAAHLSISRQAYANYEAGTREPDLNTLRALSDFFDVSIDYLLDNSSPNAVKVPVFGKVAAGIPIEAITDIEDYEEITPELAAKGDYIALRISGDSMTPEIRHGDTVIVRLQDDCDTGDIAIVLVNGNDATCKKIKKTPQGVFLVPLNADAYDEMFYSNEECESFPVRVIGVVAELRRAFKF